MRTAWCTEGRHEVDENAVVYIGEDYLPGDQTCARYACPACVKKYNLTPPVSDMFIGRPDTAPIAPGRPA